MPWDTRVILTTDANGAGRLGRNPQSPTPKIRLEKRSGKVFTVVAGLHTYGALRLDSIARELKSTFGAGGTVKNGAIEIQGDKVQPIKAWFASRLKAQE